MYPNRIPARPQRRSLGVQPGRDQALPACRSRGRSWRTSRRRCRRVRPGICTCCDWSGVGAGDEAVFCSSHTATPPRAVRAIERVAATLYEPRPVVQSVLHRPHLAPTSPPTSFCNSRGHAHAAASASDDTYTFTPRGPASATACGMSRYFCARSAMPARPCGSPAGATGRTAPPPARTARRTGRSRRGRGAPGAARGTLPQGSAAGRRGQRPPHVPHPLAVERLADEREPPADLHVVLRAGVGPPGRADVARGDRGERPAELLHHLPVLAPASPRPWNGVAGRRLRNRLPEPRPEFRQPVGPPSRRGRSGRR